MSTAAKDFLSQSDFADNRTDDYIASRVASVGLRIPMARINLVHLQKKHARFEDPPMVNVSIAPANVLDNAFLGTGPAWAVVAIRGISGDVVVTGDRVIDAELFRVAAALPAEGGWIVRKRAHQAPNHTGALRIFHDDGNDRDVDCEVMLFRPSELNAVVPDPPLCVPVTGTATTNTAEDYTEDDIPTSRTIDGDCYHERGGSLAMQKKAIATLKRVYGIDLHKPCRHGKAPRFDTVYLSPHGRHGLVLLTSTGNDQAVTGPHAPQDDSYVKVLAVLKGGTTSRYPTRSGVRSSTNRVLHILLSVLDRGLECPTGVDIADPGNWIWSAKMDDLSASRRDLLSVFDRNPSESRRDLYAVLYYIERP